MPAAPHSDLSQGHAAYTKLHQAIRDGVFGPGDRLRETDVAQRLSLSRTPVREALRKLEAEGIVQHRARIGAVIRSLSHTEVVQLYEMREVMERTAAQMAAQHASIAEIDALDDLNTQLAQTNGNSAQAVALNQDFHRTIYLSTRNTFLLDAARGLNNALMLLGPTTLADPDRIATVCAQHAEIITAMRARDITAAGEAAQTHLRTSLRYRLKVQRP